MDLLSLFQALILGIVEGLTEFLPVSSTGHLIVVGQLLNFNDERGKLFEIVIQSGAIFALCWEYRVRIRNTFAGVTRDPVAQRLVVNLAIAFVPAALIGVLFLKLIKTYLFNAPAVAAALIVGAFIIFWAERRRHVVRVHSVDQMTPLDAFKVGLAQVVSLIPGTSRSGSTIIGGLVFGLSRQTATEFSFLLSIPMLLAATGYEMYKGRALLAWDDMGMWVVGFVAAFISAFFCVRWLLRYVAHHDFVPFAWYRVFFGAVILITWQAGLVHWVD